MHIYVIVVGVRDMRYVVNEVFMKDIEIAIISMTNERIP